MNGPPIPLVVMLMFIGCTDLQRSLDENPKLVILDGKDSRIACDGGVHITQENQGKYAVRFRELNGSSVGVTDVHGVTRIETLDLNDSVRDNFGLYPTGDEKQDALLHTCLGSTLTQRKTQSTATPAELPGNPFKPNSPCWQWYNAHPNDKSGCKDDQNTQ